MLAISPWLYEIWLHGKVQVPLVLSGFVAVYIILLCWNGIFTYFLNGVGKIRLQLYASFAEAGTFIPFAWFFAKGCNMGISGIVLASIVPLVTGAVWTYIQYNKIIHSRATGIWNK